MSDTAPERRARRRDELEANLAAVTERIEKACAAAGRTPAEVRLVVVTKRFPASDVLLLHDLGVRDIGENRDQEAHEKVIEVRRVLRDEGRVGVTFHFIGQLQSNKAGRVATYADVVQSVDRAKVADALSRGAVAAGRELEVLVQLNLEQETQAGTGTETATGTGTTRGGASVAEAEALANRIVDQDGLLLRGVMAVAPREGDPAASFARLQEVASGIRRAHPGADWVSAGMTGDLEAAIENGATHLRVGTAILGSRTRLR